MNAKTSNKIATQAAIPQGVGAPQNQIAAFTQQIRHITTHLKAHKKDHSSKRGLIHLVSKRSRLMRYLQRTQPALYLQTREKLGLRK